MSVLVGIFGGERVRHRSEVGICLFGGDAGLHARDAKAGMAAALDDAAIGCDVVPARVGDPEVTRLHACCELKPCRHHANDGVETALDLEAASKNVFVAVEVGAPEAVAEDDDMVSGLIVLRRKTAAQGRWHTQYLKNIGSGHQRRNLHGLAESCDRELAAAVSGE